MNLMKYVIGISAIYLLIVVVLLNWRRGNENYSLLAFTTNITTNDIYIMDSNGKNQQKVANFPFEEYWVSWSPNARYLAYVRQMSNAEYGTHIFLTDIVTQKVYQVTTKEGFYYTPTWSADGNSLIFYGSQIVENEAYALYKLDIQTREIEIITINDVPVPYPQQTTAADMIYFAANAQRQNALNIYRYDYATDQTELIHETDTMDRDLALSPDNQLLVFSRFDANLKQSALIILDLVNFQEIQITDYEAYYWQPHWSPDGNHVAFTSNIDGEFKIYKSKVDGTERQILSTQHADSLAWSPYIGLSWQPIHLLLGAGFGCLVFFKYIMCFG